MADDMLSDDLTRTLQEQLDHFHFYHVIEIAPGIRTKGISQFEPIQQPVTRALNSIVLKGKRVLDIGCRDGLFSFQAERAGAREVIGLDNDLSRGAVDFIIPYLKSKVQMFECNVMDLTPTLFGCFDVVILAGVLYHLRFPFEALRRIKSVMKRGALLVLETAIWHSAEEMPLLYCPSGDQSPYEPTSVSFFNETGLLSTMKSFGMNLLSSSFLGEDNRHIDRLTAIFAVDVESNLDLEGYWTGIHKNHSSGDPSHRPNS